MSSLTLFSLLISNHRIKVDTYLLSRALCLSQRGFVVIKIERVGRKVDKKFLDATTHLYKRSCPSVRRSVRPSVRLSRIIFEPRIWPVLRVKSHQMTSKSMVQWVTIKWSHLMYPRGTCYQKKKIQSMNLEKTWKTKSKIARRMEKTTSTEGVHPMRFLHRHSL